MSHLFRSALPYFGSVALWQAGFNAGGFCFLAGEHYQRRSQRNRCRLAGPNGVHTLSIPLLAGKHEAAPIKSVLISYTEAWQRTHWGALQAGYGSAPYWEEYAPSLEALYQFAPPDLWAWNLACVGWVVTQLNAPLVLAEAEDWSSADVVQIPLNAMRAQSPYPQVFTERHGFLSDLCVLDLLMCQGPAAVGYLSASIAETRL